MSNESAGGAIEIIGGIWLAEKAIAQPQQ